MNDTGPLLSVEDLQVRFATRQGLVQAVRGVSFTVGREKLGIVGESGSGKSMTGRAILRLRAGAGRGDRAQARLRGHRSAAGRQPGDAPHPRQAHLHGDAGSEILAQSR